MAALLYFHYGSQRLVLRTEALVLQCQFRWDESLRRRVFSATAGLYPVLPETYKRNQRLGSLSWYGVIGTVTGLR